MVTDDANDESRPLLADGGTLEGQGPDKKVTPLPKSQLAALCVARFSDPIAYTQIFPYINEFLTVLKVTDDPSRTGFYSGIVESTSAVVQMLMIFPWAKLSDHIGRRPIILTGALGVTATSLFLGISGSFAQIVALRVVAGFFAGNYAVYQTILAELTDATNQAIAYPLYGCVYPLGATIGPLIGGFFSNAATKYPNYLGYSFVESHPYFLPGLVCASISMLGFISTFCFLEETLPSKRLRNTGGHSGPVTLAENPASSDTESMGMFRLLSIHPIRILATSSAALAFLDVGFQVVFIFFCYTPIKTGGLGFSATEIGYTLSMSSGMFAALQILVMPTLLRIYENAKMYKFCMGVWPVTFMLVPFLNIIARTGIDEGRERMDPRSTVMLWIGIAVVVCSSRVACLAYPNNAILVRNNSPNPASLGATNGLAVLAMSLSRCAGPAFVGSLFALSTGYNLLGGHLWVVIMTLIATFGWYISLGISGGSPT
ncbi:major facilitator superfamily domain-containing protein [Mycena rebaudengoi]|nr:major facilitator superfamily domain-containing protein [Mycena rebaudengoi]